MSQPDSKTWREPRELKRELQRVRMRTKIVVPMVLLAVIPTLGTGAFLILRAREALLETVVRRVEFDTVAKAGGVQEYLADVQADLRFMGQNKAVRALAGSAPAAGADQLAGLRRDVEAELHRFRRQRPFCQAQCFGALGEQLIRIEAEGDMHPAMDATAEVPIDRPYFQAASLLPPGQVLVSPMHLGAIHGMVGTVLQFATPVPDETGRIRGLLVLGVCAEHILAHIGRLPAGMVASLVDMDGVYLGRVGGADEERMRYSLAMRRALATDFSPEQVAALLNRRRVRPIVETDTTLVASAPIQLASDNSVRQSWTLLIAHPRAPVEAPIRRLTWVLAGVTGLVAVVAGLLGFLITLYLSRPLAKLQRATREIAAGDLTKRVAIATGDETEELAADFNTMTESLSQAQARLAQWNVELEREVAAQTGKVRQLQTGLARADKLASIGQITAGVMHEIGNPLAAIKAKIQVADEADELGVAQRGLFDEILVEVNRLTTFLRSFSRLARLREGPSATAVALGEVVDSVLTLLAPDLKRRRVALRREDEANLPAVRGDVEQLRHLLMNLVLNAADASRDGGEVVVRLHRGEAGRVGLQVLDHGVGVSPENLEKIWHPFFTTKAEGTGLGLAICRQIVLDHGGTIQLRSVLGRGTEVAVTFPAMIPGNGVAAGDGSGPTSAPSRAAARLP